MAVGAELHARGWSLATSSNYSVTLDRQPLRLLVTASGKHKDRLTEADFVTIDDQGRAVADGAPKSSAETMLHVVLARAADAGAVLHTHSVWGTLLSDRFASQQQLTISGYEMLKALPGVTTHETAITLPILPNTQDIGAMAQDLERLLATAGQKSEGSPPLSAFLIHKHGLYTWGADLDAARRQIEALEFLMECEGRRLMASV
ncbi:Methylthioribulose-1-phosphate dehydratase [Botrimarina hoheduenensis]|uniref:Methylthioribulose-1-phosphate dehydratase n=2 Tax=Botrimarina hoheduenensis TaxID=2528000 RepID=A0A5C5VY69_9BACT|nr:Methylthioribulose-1-phosphate dehydratase [Botrimarina hoheduenensis]